jgi:hypothetical protein
MMLTSLFEEAMSYEFNEKPNYRKLIFLLSKELFDIGVVPDKCFTWIANNRYFYGILLTNDDASEENKNGSSYIGSDSAHCKYDGEFSQYNQFFK